MKSSLQGVSSFLHDVREEMQRVSWPTRDELIGSAVVVFVGVLLLACYIGVLDFILSKVVRVLLH